MKIYREDVMDKKTNEERLKQFEKLKWRFALENSNIGIWDWDNSNNQDVVFYSEISKRILGFKTIEEGKNFGNNAQDWNNRVHPEDKDNYFKDFQNHADGLDSIYKNEHRILCNDGNYKWILDRGKIIERDENGQPTRIIGTHTDITERVENEKKMSRTLNLVSKQNKKLQNFAHIVTHNLKEHSGNFENLLGFYDEAETDKEKEEVISYLRLTASSLKKTIKDLNKIVSIEAKKEITLEKIYISKYINRVLKVLDNNIKESNATVNNYIDENLFINFSPAYLESIIQNLLSNALKYKHPEKDPIVNISYSIVGDNIYLNVSDNGIGIDLEKHGDNIFGLYKTFHNNKDAEGVGLYLVKNQIESFGGKIDVSSAPNAGTTFTITIPNKKIQLN